MLAEPHGELMEEVWGAAASVASTRLLVVEVRSALARAKREGRLSSRGAALAKEDAQRLLDAVDLVEVEPGLVATAAELAETHALRGYDALHLASVLKLDDPDVVVATWDRDLRRAARAEGLTLVA